MRIYVKEAVTGPTILNEHHWHQALEQYANADQELFILGYLNTKNVLYKTEIISMGGVDVSVVDPRIVFRRAIQNNASGIILAHNHPSGNTTPSNADISTTKRLINGGKILNIEVLDHIILGDNGNFLSMRGLGVFNST